MPKKSIMLFFKRKFKFLGKKEKEKKSEKVKEKPETKQEQGLEEKIKKAPAEKAEEQKPLVVTPKKAPQKVFKKSVGPAPRSLGEGGPAPRILIRPIITEKATLYEGQGVYTFEIEPSANKISVKKAVREVYNVEPGKVRIIRTRGKQVRYGRTTGRTKSRKKAMVYLKKGDKIEFVKHS